ncbi:MAG: thioredoxin domain-containing protein [Gemmatimonadaceae bacterium]|nr:thioredoxin domain-containing protein [Gemmatimonadaceae bacterium]
MSTKVRKQKSSNTGFIAALAAIVVAGGALMFWKSQSTPAETAVIMPNVADSVLASKSRGYTIGSPTAPVEIMEFADFECPACGSFATITEPDIRKNLVATGLVRYTFMDFPLLNAHKNTIPASMSAACADDQGKFWEMHDAIFAGQYDWSGITTDNPRSVIAKYAQAIGLDMAKWNACMDADTHLERIKANYARGMTMQVGSTPTFFVNGTKLDMRSNSYDEIKAAVDAANAANLPIPSEVPAPAK